jgi:dephospho-CoA kinase
MLSLIAVSNSPYCILSVPLLVENKLTVMCDKVVVVDCPEAMQLSRAMQRDGSTEQTIKNIMASQADRDTRLAAADFVLDNSSSLAHLAQQVDELHQTLLPLSSSHQ